MVKDDGRSFAGYGYKVVDGDRVLAEGKTDEQGGTAWIDTPRSQRVQAYKTVMRDDQRIAEAWESVMALVDSAQPMNEPSPFEDIYLDEQEGDA